MVKYLALSCLFLLVKLHVVGQIQDTTMLGKVDAGSIAPQSPWKIIKNSVQSIPKDFVQIGHGFSDHWGKTATYTGGIIGLILVDKYTTTFYQDHVERIIDYKLPDISLQSNSPLLVDFFLKGNDAYLTYSLLSIYGGSLIKKNERGQYAVINSFKALTYSYLISHVLLKSVIGRHRPDATLSDGIPEGYPSTSNPLDFGNYDGITFKPGPYGTSFPSFHATAYFAVARILSMEFNNRWLPYVGVLGIFFADIRSHKHWVADMVAGGVLGTVIGSAIVKSSRKFSTQQNPTRTLNKTSFLHKIDFNIVPQISSRSMGIHLVGNF